MKRTIVIIHLLILISAAGIGQDRTSAHSRNSDIFRRAQDSGQIYQGIFNSVDRYRNLNTKEQPVRYSSLSGSVLQSDDNWADDFYFDGTNGRTYDLLVSGNDLYICGNFTIAGNIFSNRIVKLSGEVWESFSAAFPAEWGTPTNMVTWNDELYISSNNGHIAKWDGNSWTTFASSDGTINKMIWNNNCLYIAGDFEMINNVPVKYIAMWDGENWNALGDGLPYACESFVFKDSHIYAGGRNYYYYVGYISEWNGSEWNAITTNINECWSHLVLEILDEELYVGGNFSDIDNVPFDGLARWNGSSWNDVGGGVGLWEYYMYLGRFFYENLGYVTSMHSHNGELYVTGRFDSAGCVVANNIAKWDGNAWHAIGEGIDGYIYDVAFLDNQIYVAGSIPAFNHLARWNGTQWTSAASNGKGVSGIVRAIAHDNNYIYAGGEMATASGQAVHCVAQLQEDRWYPLNEGISGGYYWSEDEWDYFDEGYWGPFVFSLYYYQNYLYVGGSFKNAGNINANNIARWNGSSWSGLGDGVSGEVLADCDVDGCSIWDGPLVRAIAADDESIYIGGSFERSGDIETPWLAEWDGMNWNPLMNTRYSISEHVNTILINDDNIFIGGSFSFMNGFPESAILSWDGSEWQGIYCVFDRVNTMVFYDDLLYVGGSSDSFNNIAAWDGENWLDVGGGVGGTINTMIVIDDQLYAGGSFSQAGNNIASNLAIWDGDNWHALGNGTNGPVYTLDVIGDKLYVGGDFDMAGNKPSTNIAVWHLTDESEPQQAIHYTAFRKISLPTLTSSVGCAWGDYNNDGYDDFFVANENNENNELFINNRVGTFSKVSTGPVVSDGGQSFAGTWGDMDNDGDLDLYVVNYDNQPNFLYSNNGDGTFTKITSGDIVTDAHYSLGCAWVDYNNDGNLDLFVANASGQNNCLYTGQGDGTFTKVTIGDIVNDGSISTMGSWCDQDMDGDADLFVANAMGEHNALYINNGDGTFLKANSDIVVSDDGQSWSGSWGDFDNDQDMDLFVANNAAANCLYENSGAGTYTKVTSHVIVNGNYASRGSCWGDLSRDGYLDLFITNRNEDSYVYVNQTQTQFNQYYTETSDSRSCAMSDFDHDGDLDLLVTNTGDKNFLYRNATVFNHHWLQVHCIGTVSNRSAIGAIIKVKATLGGVDTWQVREISSQTGFGSQSSLTAFFGLRNASIVDEIQIIWPSGQTWDSTNVKIDQILTITEYNPFINRPPVARDDIVSVNKNSAVTIHVLSNDNDPNGDDIYITSINQRNNTLGYATILPGDTTIMYTTPTDQIGWDSFLYTITDGHREYDSAEVIVQILPVNENPVALNDTLMIKQDSNLTIYPLSNDSDQDDDPLYIESILDDDITGTVVINSGDTSMTYIPSAGWSGETEFDYVASDGNGGLDTATVFITVTPVSGLTDQTVPTSFALYQNFPNPFNPVTTISYALPEKSHVTFRIFSVTGSEVVTLVDEDKSAGQFEAVWNAQDRFGRPVSSGIYFYQLKAGNYTQIRKMLLVR